MPEGTDACNIRKMTSEKPYLTPPLHCQGFAEIWDISTGHQHGHQPGEYLGDFRHDVIQED